jgi:hypothetical protein
MDAWGGSSQDFKLVAFPPDLASDSDIHIGAWFLFEHMAQDNGLVVTRCAEPFVSPAID